MIYEISVCCMIYEKPGVIRRLDATVRKEKHMEAAILYSVVILLNWSNIIAQSHSARLPAVPHIHIQESR